jgi:hypothetical protein
VCGQGVFLKEDSADRRIRAPPADGHISVLLLSYKSDGVSRTILGEPFGSTQYLAEIMSEIDSGIFSKIMFKIKADHLQNEHVV